METLANRALVAYDFVKKDQLAIEPHSIKKAMLADYRHLSTQGETLDFQLSLDTLNSNVKGPVIPIKEYGIVLGFDWMIVNKPYINCVSLVFETSTGMLSC